jgi:hypothetical protein
VWSLVRLMIRPVPAGPANRRPCSRISSQVARALTAKCWSKLSTVVSSRPDATDSQWHMTRAVTAPSSRSARSNTRAGAAVLLRSASMAAAAAPRAASSRAMACAAPGSAPQVIRWS